MVHAVRMPKPGQATEECTIVAWQKEEGEPVHRGDVLFEIETDKANMDVESFEEGILLRQVVAEGQTVPVNTICAWVGDVGEVIPDGPAAAAAELEPQPAGAGPSAPAVAGAAAGVPGLPAAEVRIAATLSAPLVRTAADGGSALLRISPRASRLAAETGIDPRTIAGTGPGGRVVERDVRAAIAGGPVAASTTARMVPPAAPAIDGSAQPSAALADGEEEPRPLSRMRRVIADRLTQSWQTIPTFTVTVAVDVTRLLALRVEIKAAGTLLTVTDFVLAATAQSLVEFPDVNSRTDGVFVWRRRRVHLGVAVSLPAGLVVPVIRDADRLSLIELHERAAQLAAAARQGMLAVDDMSGSTFTVSNLGMFGVEQFSAIINPGEAAILAVSSATPMAVAVGDSTAGGLTVRTIMRLTLSADHRIVDGEMGARFVNAIRRRLEDPASFRWDLANA